jgi:hypothetical protein
LRHKIGRAELSKLASPDNLFAHTGKVLVDHDGDEHYPPEAKLKDHLEHGNESINLSGCSEARQGR